MAGLTALLRGSRKATKVKAPKKVLNTTEKMKGRAKPKATLSAKKTTKQPAGVANKAMDARVKTSNMAHTAKTGLGKPQSPRTVGPNEEGAAMKSALGVGRTAMKKLDALSSPLSRVGRDMKAKKSVRIKPLAVKPLKPTVKRLPR